MQAHPRCFRKGVGTFPASPWLGRLNVMLGASWRAFLTLFRPLKTSQARDSTKCWGSGFFGAVCPNTAVSCVCAARHPILKSTLNRPLKIPVSPAKTLPTPHLHPNRTSLSYGFKHRGLSRIRLSRGLWLRTEG